MKFINLTPHTLNIHTQPGEIVDVEPSGSVARVNTDLEEVGKIGNIPIWRSTCGEVIDLPEPQDGVVYIVSGMVEAATSRSDVYAPGNLVRNEAGQPIGCMGLKQS